MIEIPNPVFDFIQSKIQVENIPFLPYFYPTPENFIAFQEGYRYNPTTGENLIGNTIGWWKKDWYAIASTYSNDPFIIKLNANIDYPVYFAWHSTGKWEPFKIMDSIQDFKKILLDLKNTTRAIHYLKANMMSTTSYWNEIILALENT